MNDLSISRNKTKAICRGEAVLHFALVLLFLFGPLSLNGQPALPSSLHARTIATYSFATEGQGQSLYFFMATQRTAIHGHPWPTTSSKITLSSCRIYAALVDRRRRQRVMTRRHRPAISAL
jgi:hypothetical protein